MTEKAPQHLDIPHSKILVCDDDFDARTIIGHSIRALGHDVLEASSGQEAIEICERSLPDCVVMDIMMPGITGHEFLIWFRAFQPESFIPVLFLTALTEVDNRVQGLELGADDYLTKPFNYRELQARVGALLRIKHLTDRLISQKIEIEQKNKEITKMQSQLLKKEREIVASQIAGTAAHSLGQPLTTILLNCSLLEHSLSDNQTELAAGLRLAINSIKSECAKVDLIAQELKSIDPEKTEGYLGDLSIISLGNKKSE